jgi:hypothetical protein
MGFVILRFAMFQQQQVAAAQALVVEKNSC